MTSLLREVMPDQNIAMFDTNQVTLIGVHVEFITKILALSVRDTMRLHALAGTVPMALRNVDYRYLLAGYLIAADWSENRVDPDRVDEFVTRAKGLTEDFYIAPEDIRELIQNLAKVVRGEYPHRPSAE